MIHVLTDEEWVTSADEQIDKVARAIADTCLANPGTTAKALSDVLWRVNGPVWICSVDQARARVKAKALIAYCEVATKGE